ncbi:tetratricopeptide repeat protein [Pseudomonas sp. 681]|uniref:Tetratricopeptide repeat protein n=1 Tax=Pseudomonas fungipugnans TaxID=3024217 RepID=A0ABT6QPS4_9PSED|nr:tetratricopeptide repeat protein [Pseudomonas sp. 681]MDI2592785.1 tetratricopeptide repeat protein [Pseudomonas sp. 681]
MKSLCRLYLLFFFSSFCYAADSNLVGVSGAALKFSSWDQDAAVWKHATFSKNDQGFSLYEEEPSSSVGLGINSDSLAPSKEYALIQRTVFGELNNKQQVEATEKSYCDMVSMDTGCVLLSRPAEACSGSWKGENWKTDEGEIINPKLETISPKELVKSVATIADISSKAFAIRGQLFMGAESYMSCYPAAKNVQALNDLGFYLAQAGDDSFALRIYRGIEVVGNRTVLMLNIADSLWNLKKTSEAIEYYNKYSDSMTAEGKAAKVPVRVVERVK